MMWLYNTMRHVHLENIVVETFLGISVLENGIFTLI